MRSRHIALASVLAALAGCGGDHGGPRPRAASTAALSPAPSAAPAPQAPPAAAGAPLPGDAAGIAADLASVRPRLCAAARAWDGTGTVPDALGLLALREQRLVLRLSDRPSLVPAVLAALPAGERRAVRDDVRALRDLRRLSASWPVKRRHRVGPPAPAASLWRAYRAAHRRFGVPAPLLAAVNFVESAFGRQRSDSVAGAQGPMQFIPATWAAYGLGGDVQDPRDAILGAANLLHANGSPADDPAALYHYNRSRLYVDAVLRYARRARTRAGFRTLYARSVFVRAPGGGRRRLTGPGLRVR